MILSLLSMLGGGLLRLMPELFGFLHKKTDNAHELAMLERQFQLEQTRAASQQALVEYQGGVEQALALLDAQKTALQGQMQPLGIWWADALNFLVRPLATYYVLLMYGLAKLAMFVVALQSGIGGWEAILRIYDAEDRAILSGILAFWFVGRVFDKQK
ncbi:hypothetical protein MJ904_15605 [Massilia sp. MB5]|uniref:Uncharacterized protein n=1 Tax=Pseudoduganella violacea TaxID=1715466 RepID=A0A7W5FT94_9BURK|nr:MULTISPECIES: hypothetical protein [Telluria group]AKU21805.1 hypothetical protein ACZ75_10330 [Massilia sp. NR 4-1]MBB3118610.1 hypothetical protein [Pseudoduganella violacea]UMR28570.1 hypothetical protein MJ904_15605 [Massilia sp. MB5]